ncbi:hypothetical protein KA005_29750, partial [bacterium]|nr:hypothetical protein [bacterium]
SSDMDFFAKFGVKQSREKQMAHSYYLQALGYHGKGMHKDAAKAYGKALNLDSNHLWARFGLSQVK